MPTSPKVIAVVPAHNEARTVDDVVRSLLPAVSEVIVVDDASGDGTGEIARQAGATMLRNETSRGYDGAIDRGFSEAARRGADIIMTFDADGEHDAKDIPTILAPILEGRADVVAGQRPRVRHWGEVIFASYTKMRFGIRDPLCGLKAYRRQVYDSVGFFDRVHSIGTELMLRARAKGYRIVLVPIVLHERMDDRSRFYFVRLRGNLNILGAMIRTIYTI